MTGIGCTGKADDYLVTHALHTTHGRALAYATGIKAFNPKLHVVVLMGDGDSVTIGGNHFIHAARRNIDLTAIVINNFNYGMTGGRSPAPRRADSFTSTTAWGNPERDFDICALAEVAGANYVARETPYHGWEMKELIKEALNKKGFSLVEVFSPCPTHFGKNNEMKQTREMLDWFKERGLPVERYRKLSVAEQGKTISPSGNWWTGMRRISIRDMKRSGPGRWPQKARGKVRNEMKERKRDMRSSWPDRAARGLVLAGIMLGEAAILEGKIVVQTQSYGIASRGGFSLAEVIIDREEIIYQQVQEPDIILALTEEALEKYAALAEKGVPVFYDTTLAKAQSGGKPDRLSVHENRQRSRESDRPSTSWPSGR